MADAATLEAPTTDEKKEAPRTQRVIGQNFGLHQFKRRTWFYELTEGQTRDDVLQPEFWADKVSEILGHDGKGGAGDWIVLDKPDTGWAAIARISSISRGNVKVKLFMECAADVAVIPEDSPLITRWNPGTKKHDVGRKEGNSFVLLQAGFSTKPEAVAWIADHKAKMAA